MDMQQADKRDVRDPGAGAPDDRIRPRRRHCCRRDQPEHTLPVAVGHLHRRVFARDPGSARGGRHSDRAKPDWRAEPEAPTHATARRSETVGGAGLRKKPPCRCSNRRHARDGAPGRGTHSSLRVPTPRCGPPGRRGHTGRSTPRARMHSFDRVTRRGSQE